MNASKPFQAVGKNDEQGGLGNPLHASKATDPFGCMYVIQYNGATFKTFFGAGHSRVTI